MAVLLLPVGVTKKRLESNGRVANARGVAKQRIDSGGGVEETRGVAKQRIESGGGVVGTCGVAGERTCAQAGVALRHRNPRQREREYESSYKAGEKRSSVGRMVKHIIPSLFKVICRACLLKVQIGTLIYNNFIDAVHLQAPVSVLTDS